MPLTLIFLIIVSILLLYLVYITPDYSIGDIIKLPLNIINLKKKNYIL